MLTKTTATATASLSVVSALSSTTPSPFLCHFTSNSSRFFTPPNPLSNFFSIRWNTNKHNTYNKNKCNNFGTSRMESFTIKASAQPLKNAEELINSVETFVFDCDGVIWKGDKLIDGVPETLDMLRSKGKRLVFVTNNSTKSRKQYGKKFETLGLNVNEEEIFASSFAAAAYLKSINFPKDKKVYVIGEDGILKELELAGFQYLGGPVHCLDSLCQ
uniref:Phosphoglycolate phosphatase n=1 Tax=Quercus lobata TaxID=97700 RepID=A0A7N2KQT6_QUELO